MAHKVVKKQEPQPVKPYKKESCRWDKWNKALYQALERSIEAGRSFIEESYLDVFDVPKPANQTYRKCGLKIGYYLQEQDSIANGMVIDDRMKRRYEAAANFKPIDSTLSSIDPWGMDVDRPNRTGNPQNLKPKEKGERANDIEKVMKGIAVGMLKITCGKGTKGETTFIKGPKPNTIEVKAKKNPFVYDITKDWDKNALYWRLWRWSRKEDILK